MKTPKTPIFGEKRNLIISLSLFLFVIISPSKSIFAQVNSAAEKLYLPLFGTNEISIINPEREDSVAEKSVDETVDPLESDGFVSASNAPFELNAMTTLINADFNSDTDSFVYVDDAFRNTNQPGYASGSRQPTGGFSGGGLQVLLGGINDAIILDMSGGWQRNFSLASAGDVSLSIRYRLDKAPNYESDEFSQVLVSVDGNLIGTPPNSYVAQLTGNGNGGTTQTTSWQLFQADLGQLPAGNHVLAIGGYVNKKTLSDESSAIRIDDVLLSVDSANQPPSITNPGNQSNSAGESVTLPIAASDPENVPLTFSAVGLPPNLTINGSTGVITGILAGNSNGSYSVTINVSDGTATESVTFEWSVGTLSNNPPVANAGPDQSVTDSDGNGSESITLNGGGSTDDGVIVSYAWSGISGVNIPAVVNPTVSVPVGSYNVTLTVTDDEGATATDSVSITVSEPSNPGDNPIVIENQQAGSRAWKINNPASDNSMQIKGYASLTSVNKGQPISFHVHVSPAQPYTIDVFRMGYYDGDGGRLMQSIGPLNGTPQPAPTIDGTTGMVSTSWASSYTLQVPNNWTSGIYLAKLTNANGFENHIIFVVRDDGRNADFLYQQPVNTYQAYNNFPNNGTLGKSLYNYNSAGSNTISGAERAVKVSFDRPYADSGSREFFKWEVYLVRWLEKEGYDVAYATNIDLHTSGINTSNYEGFISAGHDEYWTKEMYDAAEVARDSGVNLMFTSANTTYWQVRLENNNRVLVSYKSASIDPISNPAFRTIKFRDNGRAEQALVGVQYVSYNANSNNNTDFIVQNSNHWVYENSGLTNGSRIANIIGYEADHFDPSYPSPPANGTQVLLSDSAFVDQYGETVRSNGSVYQASSGAWVFATGTSSWSWALDRNGYVNSGIQQVTRNVLNRFINATPPSNQPPIVSTPANQTTTIGTNVSLPITASDPEQDPLSFSATGLPPGLSINASSGLISGTPTAAGSYSVGVSVSDGTNTTSISFTWTVNDVTAGCGALQQEAENGTLFGRFVVANDPNASGGQYIHTPEGSGNANFGSSSRAVFCFDVGVAGDYVLKTSVLAADGTSNSFFVTVDGLPTSGHTWDLALSTLYTVDYVSNRNGQDPVTVSLGAGQHEVIIYLREDGTRLDTIGLEAAGGPINSPPQIVNPGAQNRAVGTPLSLQISASDPDGDVLTYSANGLPPGLVINSNSGVVSGTPTSEGSYSSTVIVSDGSSNASTSIAWTITSGGSCGPLSQEAEAGTLSGSFVSVADGAASGGQFIHVPGDQGSFGFGGIHRASYCFDVPTAGTYQIDATVQAANGTSNSFFVTIDGSPSGGILWAIPTGPAYIQDYVSDRNGQDPVAITLAPGPHTVTVYARESGTRLDRIALELVSVQATSTGILRADGDEYVPEEEPDQSAGSASIELMVPELYLPVVE